jgi:hypothetical protein
METILIVILVVFLLGGGAGDIPVGVGSALSDALKFKSINGEMI